MSVATANQPQIPFVDLKAQYVAIKEEVRRAIDQVLDSAQFVGGEWVENLEMQFARFIGAELSDGRRSCTVEALLGFAQ
jgi:dTDP-4-amino-4,6-dideoxygalactose transaminase